MGLEVIVLAAGSGSRMRTKLPKVLHKVGGKAMLSHVIDAVKPLQPHRIHVVIQPNMLSTDLRPMDADINWVTQEHQLGSGHAASVVLPLLAKESEVLIVNGDGPLVRTETLSRCVKELEFAELAVVSAQVSNPKGYGRILRDEAREVRGIIEDADLAADQHQLNEVNSGILGTSADVLKEFLPRIKPKNQQKEIYLTDLLALARCAGKRVTAVLADDPEDILGVNTRKQLAEVERVYQRRQAEQLMDQGTTFADPSRIDIRGQVQAGIDCEIDVDVVLEGDVELSDNVKIGSHCVLKDVQIGEGTVVRSHTVIENAVIGSACSIGPFARIRPGSTLGDDVRVGNFVELKNAELADGVKAGHLAYLGDVEVGQDSNIGAGAITCNFDGEAKHRTTIGNHVFIGTNASLVAPLIIQDKAFIAAGSTITKDVESEAFAIARERQRDIAGGATRLLKS